MLLKYNVFLQERFVSTTKATGENTWHFAHYNPERQLTENSHSCSYSKESELHLAGKHLFNRLVQDTGFLRLPEFTLTYKQIANSPALSLLTKDQQNFVLAQAGTNPEPSTGVSFSEVSHLIDHCELEPTEGMEDIVQMFSSAIAGSQLHILKWL